MAYYISSAWRLLRISVTKFFQDRCITISSSISYYFLLSLIPLSSLGLMLLDLVQRRALAQLGLETDVGLAMTENIHHVVPFISQEWLETYVVNTGASGSFKIFTVALLPIVGGLVFSVLGDSYRRIFRLPKRHMLVGRAVASVFAIFVVVMLFAVNFFLSILIPSIGRIMEETTGFSAPLLETFTRFASRFDFISPLVLVAFFIVSVKVFVNIRMRRRYLLFGGAVFCGLWLVAKTFFAVYIDRISDVNVLYGSLSSIVILLMWIFYSSVALLYSLEVLYVLTTREHRPPFMS